MKLILIIALFLYSIFSSFIHLKTGKINFKEENKSTKGFKFIYFYGEFFLIAFPIIAILILLFDFVLKIF